MKLAQVPPGFDPDRDPFPGQVRLGEPCQCGSGQKAIYCCWSNGHFLPKAVKRYRRPRGILISNPGCYAAPLRDCSKKLSGEHWLSKSLLRAVAKGSKKIGVLGHDWQTETLQVVGIEGLNAKILCERHNEALSGLDTVMQRFARALVDAERILHSADLPDDAHDVHLFRGDDVERWLLKAVIGAVVTGHATGVPRTWKPPIDWLEYLFLDGALPPSRGFFFPQFSGVRPIVAPFSSVYLAISAYAGEGQGPLPRFAQFWICGMDVVCITPYAGRVEIPNARTLLHRPGEIRLVSGARFVSFILGWQTPGADSRRSTMVRVKRMPIQERAPS